MGKNARKKARRRAAARELFNVVNPTRVVDSGKCRADILRQRALFSKIGLKAYNFAENRQIKVFSVGDVVFFLGNAAIAERFGKILPNGLDAYPTRRDGLYFIGKKGIELCQILSI